MPASENTPRRVPLLDLAALHAPLHPEIMAALESVIASQRFILGEEVARFEREVAAYCRTPHAVACASGTDALLLALLAAGIGPGDQVLTSPFTFFATAGAVTSAGATPVFADIDPDTFNLDPQAAVRVLRAYPRVRAMIPVHLYGACADLDPLAEAARSRGCVLIEDAAQSIGAEYKGRPACTLGDIACLSFFPTKNLGAWGDGGMLLTGDAALAGKLAALRVHGSLVKYHHRWVGINSRLDTLQAAVLSVKLRYLDGWSEARGRNAGLYRSLLGQAGLPVRLPAAAGYQTRHVYNQFVVRCPERDRLKQYLESRGVGTEIYYPLPLHLQPCYAQLGYRQGDFPEAEKAAAEVLALPIHSALEEADIRYVCATIREFYA